LASAPAELAAGLMNVDGDDAPRRRNLTDDDGWIYMTAIRAM